MKEKVLVTGGAGYIGSHLVNLLSEKEFDITVLDNLSTGRRAAVLKGELIVGDVGDVEFCEKLFREKKFDGVFHFAGSIIVPESVTDPISYYQNNFCNGVKLLNLCQKYHVKRFIFSSTATVYGMPTGHCHETDPTLPISPYGHTKRMFEQVLQDLGHAHKDFHYLILRYFNVAGANPNGLIGQGGKNATHLIKVASQVALGKRSTLTVYGEDYPTPDGTCIRDYIHVDDLAAAHIDGYRYLVKGGKSDVVNVGYGHGLSVKEIVTTVKKVTGIDFPVEVGARRDGDASILVGANQKIKKLLGWEPQFDNIEFIVKTAFDWEKKNQ